MQQPGSMMDRPLLVSAILEHGENQYGDQQIVSRDTDGSLHRYRFADMAQRARQLANALQALGLRPGSVVGSLAWNNHRHLEAYYAVSGSGMVMHTCNWVHNAPTSELEKIYVDYKKKTGDDFVFAAHWNSVHMLREAMRKAQSTDAKKVAFALENMTCKSPMGEVRMRKTDHQLEAPLYLGIWAKQGSKGVKYDAEKTGYGFRSEVAWDNYISSQPTSCQMKRPS